MAISNINPAQNSVIRPGDAFSFDIANGYTALVVKIVQSSGEEYAYDYALGGTQAGYTVVVEDLGGSDRYTISRDEGFNREPTVVKVTENVSGVTTTEWSYFLTATAIYPEGMQPYNDSYEGTLLVTEDDVQVRNDVGWFDFDAATFSVQDLGNGKVRVIGTAAAGNDPDAIHDNVANEISAITEKLTTAGDDLILIEDSEDGGEKKGLKIENLPSLGGGAGGGIKIGQWEYQAGNGDEVSHGGFRFSLAAPTYGNNLYINMDQDMLAEDRNYVLELCKAGSYVMFREQGTEDYAIVPPVTAVNGQHPFTGNGTGGNYRRFFIDSSEVHVTSGFNWVYSTTYDVYILGGLAATLMGGLMEEDMHIGFSHSFVAGNGSGEWGLQSHAQNEFDPGPTSDFDGYKLGSLWSNEPGQSLWVCINNENPNTNTAIWRPLLEGTVVTFGGGWDIDDTHGVPNANGEADVDSTDPDLVTQFRMFKFNGSGVDQSADMEGVTVGARLTFRFGEGTSFDYFDVTGVTDNTTYMTYDVTVSSADSVSYPRNAEDASASLADLYVKRSGTQEQNTALFREVGDHANVPATGLAQLWVGAAKGAGGQYLKYTDEAGTDFSLTPAVKAAAPTATDDINDGHEIGQCWVNTALDDAYICCDNAAGAAVWKIIAT